MKLWETCLTQAQRRNRNKKALRKFVSNNSNTLRHFKRNGMIKHGLGEKVVAPTILDIVTFEFKDKVLGFLEDIEKKARAYNKSGPRVHVCFRNTTQITSSAGILILAKLETLRANHPEVKYSVSRPPVTRNKSQRGHVVDSVLNRIGVYSALGQNKRVMRENQNVKCWEVIRGELVESEMVGSLLEGITEKLGSDYSDLYRPLIEAMSNSVEHAYRDDLYDASANNNKNKWWCFAAIMDERLILSICDLGVGIPKTLKMTQEEGFLAKIIEILGKPLELDSDHIKASLQVKRTRTKLGYRGKGGTDLQSIIENYDDSRLRIFSNFGNYQYTSRKNVARPEIIWDGKKSLGGTIVEWNVPLSC